MGATRRYLELIVTVGLVFTTAALAVALFQLAHQRRPKLAS